MKLSKNLKQKHQESNWVGSKKVPEIKWKKKNYIGSKNSKSNLCSTHPNYKHFASKRGNSCLDLVPTKCQAIFERKQCETKSKNLLFNQETCKNWNDSSWKGRTRTAFWKSFVVFSFCLPWHWGMAGADVSAIHFLFITRICTICPWVLLIIIISWLLAGM